MNVVINKANQFVSFKFGNVQLLDILHFLGGATNLDSFSKASKSSDMRSYFQKKGSNIKKSSKKLAFHLTKPILESILNLFGEDHSDFQKLLDEG